MTDPASPAAVTDERISEIRLRSTNYSPRHGHIPAMDDVAALLAAFDARGLELARRDEEVARLKVSVEAARIAHGSAIRAAAAAEANLEKAREVLTVISTKGCAPSSQPPTQCPSCIAADYLRVTETQSAGEALDPAGPMMKAEYLALIPKIQTNLHDLATKYEDNYLPEVADTLGDLVGHIRAQASALAEARKRGSINLKPLLATAFEHGAVFGRSKQQGIMQAAEEEADKIILELERALTEPQHGNG